MKIITAGALFGLGLLSAATVSASPPPPAVDPVDTTDFLDLTPSAEEQMVSEGLPPTPESGNENPEELLKSAPAVHGPRKSAKSSSPSSMPEELPLVGGSEPATESQEDLPPLPEVEAEEVVAESEPAAPTEGESTRKWDRRTPLYDRENPNWGLELHGSLQALGSPILSEQLDISGTPTGAIESSDVRNFGLGFEYEPSFFQSIGVVSIGPSFNFYILEPAGDLTESGFSIFSVGASIKYQLKFMRGQFLVPFVGFESQMIRYSFDRASIGNGWTTASGPTFGAMLLLNTFEPDAAHTLWAETGVRRSYLFGEVKNLTAGETILSTEGTAIFFGLRLEI